LVAAAVVRKDLPDDLRLAADGPDRRGRKLRELHAAQVPMLGELGLGVPASRALAATDAVLGRHVERPRLTPRGAARIEHRRVAGSTPAQRTATG